MSKHWRDAMNDRHKDWIANRDRPKGGSWEGGKGSRSRVGNSHAYKDNWDKIFGDKKDGTSSSEESS